MFLCGGLQDAVDLASMQLRGSPFTDAEELLPTCYRCGSSNPLVNAQVSFVLCTSFTRAQSQAKKNISDGLMIQ